MKRKKIMMGILAVMLLSLVACGKGQGTTKAETTKSGEKYNWNSVWKS